MILGLFFRKFIPMGTGIHWYLATVTMKTKQIFITDSQDMSPKWLDGVPNNKPKEIEAMGVVIQEFFLSEKQRKVLKFIKRVVTYFLLSFETKICI
jgi:Ulp1 family protease